MPSCSVYKTQVELVDGSDLFAIGFNDAIEPLGRHADPTWDARPDRVGVWLAVAPSGYQHSQPNVRLADRAAAGRPSSAAPDRGRTSAPAIESLSGEHVRFGRK